MNDFDIISSSSQLWYNFFVCGGGGGVGLRLGIGLRVGGGNLRHCTSEFLLCICE